MERSLMWSLGTFTPDLPQERNYNLRNLKVYNEFATFLREHCTAMMNNHPDIRSPDHEHSLRRSTGQTWHHDGSLFGRRCYMAVWSNGVGTEIRDPADGTIYQAAPGEVTLFHNAYFEHRPPIRVPKADKLNRWFARASFPISGKVKDIDGVYVLDLESGRGPTHPERM